MRFYSYLPIEVTASGVLTSWIIVPGDGSSMYCASDVSAIVMGMIQNKTKTHMFR